MRNHQTLLFNVCVAIALGLASGGVRAEPKKAPIRIGALHNLTGAL